jgi:hypothetical protein
MVNAGSNLTASHIVQNTIVIGGTSASRATITIAASNAQGHLSVSTTSVSGSSADFATNPTASSISADSGPMTSLATVGEPSGNALDGSCVRGISSSDLGATLGLAAAAVPVEESMANATAQFLGSIVRPEKLADSNEPAPNLSTFGDATRFVKIPDAEQPDSVSLQPALDTVLEEAYSWLARADLTLKLLADLLHRSQVA